MLRGIFDICEKLILKFIRQTRAAVLPMVAVMFPVVMGMAAVGTDFSAWMQDKNNLQTAADAAALAGAYEAMNGSNAEADVEAAALNEALANGWVNGTDATMEINYTAGGADGVGTEVEVTLRMPTYIWLSSLMRDGAFVAATAGVRIFRPNNFCMLSLDPTAKGAVTIAGTATIDAPGCGIAVNSDNDRALEIQGNADITIGDVSIAGDYNIIGNSAEFNHGDLDTNSYPVEDPYADLDVPEYEPCSESESYSGSEPYTVPNPDGFRVLCGIDISGTNDIDFEPGIYVLDGGSFNVQGGGTLTSEGATFILAGSGNDYARLNVTGGKTMNFTAPVDESNEFAGVIFFQDRDAPYSTNKTNRLLGTSEITLNGVSYFPNQQLDFGGNNTADIPACSMIIARTVELQGTPNMGTDCSGMPVEYIDPPTIQLVY